MARRPFSNADPLLKIILLFLLSFVGVAIFLMMANGLVQMLWGISFFSDASALQDYSNPQIVQVNRVLLLFQHLGLFVVPAIVFAAMISSDWKAALGFRKLSLWFFAGAVLVMLASLPLINGLSYLNQIIKFPEALASLEDVFMGMEESAAEITQAITGSGSVPILLFNILVVALLPAFGEEMIFRGLLLPIIRKWSGSVHVGVWVSALLFSAMHVQFYGFIPRMVLGGLLGYLFVWSKSLWAPILAHFTNNAFALVLLFFIARGDISEEVDSFEPSGSDLLWFGVSLVGVLILMFFLWKKRNQLPEGSASEIRRG